ncbi:MAG TPA: hypothetical protein PLN33_21950, partial [Hyphomonadaceae bacterium]|nr:hypothetical protein [Hyphomonadaceae bacterium]
MEPLPTAAGGPDRAIVPSVVIDPLSVKVTIGGEPSAHIGNQKLMLAWSGFAIERPALPTTGSGHVTANGFSTKDVPGAFPNVQESRN